MGDEVDGSDCIAARPSRSQPCSHHPSFSSPTGTRFNFGFLTLKKLSF